MKVCIGVFRSVANALEANGYQETSSPEGLEARLLRAGGVAADKQIRKLTKKTFDLNAMEFPAPEPLTGDSRMVNLSESMVKRIEQEFVNQGGEVRISRFGGNYFKVENGKAIIVLAPFTHDSIVAHELSHFLDWKLKKEELVAQGKSEAQAARLASDIALSPKGVFIAESRAKNAELSKMLHELTAAENNGDDSFTLHTPRGPVSMPLTDYVRPEDLIAHAVYPYVEQIKAAYNLKRQSQGLQWKLWSLPNTRAEFAKRMDVIIEESEREMGRRAVTVRELLISEAVRLAGEARTKGENKVAEEHLNTARKLRETPLLDFILFAHDLNNDVQGHGKNLKERLETAVFAAEVESTSATKLSKQSQEEVEASFTRVRTNHYGERYNRNSIGPEYRYQGPEIEANGYAQLDIEGLGFSSMRGEETPLDGVISKQRILTLLHAPIVDPVEIRARQQAVRELLDSDNLILSGIKKVVESKDSRNWRRVLWNFTEPQIHRAFERSTDHLFYKEILTPKVTDFLRPSKKEQIARLKNYIEPIKGFFREIQQMRSLLKGAKSPRLQQLKWVLDSAFDPNHPYQLAADVKGLLAPDSLRENYDALNRLEKGKPGELGLLQNAYAELALFFDIANNAQNKGWKAFPKILDPEPKRGPILNVADLHNPRVLATNPTASVPNSVQIGGEAGNHIIVTGPNAEGKSTIQRTLAQEAILAQMGSPVPAVSAEQTPLSIVVYVHPKDNPSQETSLFMAEGKALMNQIYNKSKGNAFTLAIMDEILPGTIAEIREDVESEFLAYLAKTGGISVTATHNWGTTSLGAGGRSTATSSLTPAATDEKASNQFRNLHVDHFRVVPGPASNLDAMYAGAITALRKVGWPEEVLEKIRARGEKRTQSQR